MFLLYSLLVIEGADQAILPASFKALEHDLGLTPSMIAAVFMGQKAMESIARPLWGCAVDSGRVSRKSVLGFCCAGWGISTMCLGATSFWPTMALCRILTGIFLSAIHPLVQSIIADSVAPERRGRAFGYASLIESLGGLTMGFICTSLSMQTFSGVSGWRWIYACVGVASIVWGLVISVMMPEPERPDSFVADQTPFTICNLFGKSFARLQHYLTETASFRVITLQGCFGAVPFAALSFQSMWLQSLGTFDMVTAASIGTIGAVGSLPGVLFGGYLGDWLESSNGIQARPYAAMFSLGCAVVLSYILFNVVSTSSPVYMTLVIFIMHFCICWCQVAVNRPVLIRTVRPEHTASVMGWSLGLEGLCYSFFGAPSVGFLADHVFGYVKGASGPGNAAALGKGMTIMCVLPWLVAFVIYSFLPRCIEIDMLRNKNNECQPLNIDVKA